MPQFMLLLHRSTTAGPARPPAEAQAPQAGAGAAGPLPPGPRTIGREAAASIVARYVAWSGELQRSGRLVRGDKLEDGTGRVLRKACGAVQVTDGPFAEARELVGGFYIIEAQDWDDAAAIARGCPHLELGGSIELRRLEVV